MTIDCRSPVSGTTGNAKLKLFEGEGTGGTLLSTQDISIEDIEGIGRHLKMGFLLAV